MYNYQHLSSIPNKIHHILIGISFLLNISWSNYVGSPNVEKIVSSLDRTIHPCDDFYAFACNKWIKSNPIPSGYNGWSPLAEIEERNKKIIKNLLEKPIDKFTSDAERKAKQFYQSCLDTNNVREQLAAAPMLELIHILGGWSATDKAYNASRFNLQKTLKMLINQFNIPVLFEYSVNPDLKEASRNALYLNQSRLTLPTEFYSMQNELDKLSTIMTKIGVLLGGEEKPIKNQMQDVINFERKLAKISVSNDAKNVNKSYTIGKLQKLSGFIDWTDFFQDALAQLPRRVSKSTKVIVTYPNYFKKLSNLMKEYQKSANGKRVLNNYLIWRTVMRYQYFLSVDFRKANKNLFDLIYKVPETEFRELPKWITCQFETQEKNSFGFAIIGMLVRETSGTDSREKIQKMVTNIRHVFGKTLDTLEWMDEETHKAAKMKLDYISELIAYPDFIGDSKKIDKFYKNVNIQPITYFWNVIGLRKHAMLETLKKLDKPIKKIDWEFYDLLQGNAFYEPEINTIKIPIGILQTPVYDVKNLIVQNYGAIGFIIAHEITHGFDSEGGKYDKDGIMQQWWSNQTMEKFNNLIRCFVDQYENYDINGQHINGTRSLPDNISDNGGLKAAYDAYFKNFEEVTYSQQGLNLSDQQLFFIAFAQTWCSNMPDEVLQNILNETHVPKKYRVIGTLQNSVEFSNAFKCKKSSYMNPQNKCKLF